MWLLKLLPALLTFLRSTIINNERVRGYAKSERNEFTLLLALSVTTMAFIFYYGYSKVLNTNLTEAIGRLDRQAEFIESVNMFNQDKIQSIERECQIRVDRLSKELINRDIIIDGQRSQITSILELLDKTSDKCN